MRQAIQAAFVAVLGLGLSSCAQGPGPMEVDAMQDSQCRSWGHLPASPGYAQCRQTLFLNQQQFEAEKRAAGMRLIQSMRN